MISIAPDLGGTPEVGAEQKALWERSQIGSAGTAAYAPRARHRGRPAFLRPLILGPDQSALQRDQLLAELEHLQTSEEAAVWAQQNLPTKNALTATTRGWLKPIFNPNSRPSIERTSISNRTPPNWNLVSGNRTSARRFRPSDGSRNEPVLPAAVWRPNHSAARQGSSPIRIPTALPRMR